MKTIRQLRNWASAYLPGEFLSALDLNLEALNTDDGPSATTGTIITLTPLDKISSLQVDATAAAATVYLPDQPNGSRRRTVTKTDASANAVTVNGNGNNINGATTYVLAAQYDSVTVEPTGSAWLVVASYP